MGGLERPKFVLFGSSIVQLSYINEGWGAALAHIYARKADIVLRGYSGWNSRRAVQADIVLRGYSGWNSRRAVQVLDQVFPKDAAIQPSLVIVYFGGNDSVHPHATGLGPHVPLPEYIENTRKIAMHLKSISDKTRVIFLSAPPASEEQIGIHLRGKMDMVRTNEYCRIYSEACLEVCREMNLKAVDLWTAIQQVDNWETVCLKDGIHFAPEGSRMIVKEILRVIKEAQWEPSLYWKAMPTEFSEDSPYDPVGVEGKTVNVSEPDLFGDFPWE
ncbi:GDSL esterase/lipase CPRD49-like isoform X1 [Populus alba x Populus x berolinensis]|uniref:GDSL esterase/lipase CPRD49-like isoform X1 n=1 Tax=Populus alba x Populus x berolinensis TaxID=444605 RepID=A0AAD6LKK8_9ROSI|nr:GDSL esterase/lipase CPRD49-like isoform X1 [Populus alba x Populus x berolinensis]